MPPTYSANGEIQDSQLRLVSPRINVSLKPTQVSILTTATLLPANSRQDRTFILVQNQGPNPVFLGDNTVTTSNGYQLNPLSDITIPCNDTAVVYAIAAAPGSAVSILEGV